MYVKITNGNVDTYPYSVGQLRRDNPNVSFPKHIPDDVLADWGVRPVNPVPVPNYNERTQWANQNDTPHIEGEEWFLGWTITDKTAEEIEQYDDAAAEMVRVQRNELLSESDWTQVADAPVDQAAWATYRQALRDITAQEGFPLSVTWPTKPE
jgi:hypothetical protein